MMDMGILESEARYERRKGYIQNAVLSTLALSGILLVAVMAPNVIQLLAKFGGNKYKLAYQLKSVATRLAHKGLVTFSERNGKKCLTITDKGRRVLEMEQQRSALEARARRKWDKRWRMIIFDIPEKYRKTRDKLRLTLRSLGFVQLQASVWVYPYDCEEVIALLKSDLRLGGAVLYTIVEKIENDKSLKQHFKL